MVEARRKAIIVGGSMSGLIAALLLRRDGWHVDVYERVDVELAGRGAGIVTHNSLFEVLRSAGVDVTPDFGVSVRSRKVFDADGTCSAMASHPQLLTSWDRMYQGLRSQLPDDHYHKGCMLVGASCSEDGVTATFANGVTITADLLIGADGFRSATRDRILPDVAPKYVGYVAWRGMVEESELSPETHRDLFEHFAFSLPDGEQMLGYPVAGADNDTRPGRRRYNFVWYRPADDKQLRNLLTDETGTLHEISIAPPLIRREVIDDIRNVAVRRLSPQFQEVVRLTKQPFFQPIYDLEVPQMAVDRIALIGDAAFVARPHVGAGVTKAADDALALADALRNAGDDVRAGLRAFERQRLSTDARIIARARQLGAYMQSQIKSADEKRDAERFRTPDAVMRETASLDFLYA